MRDIPVTAETRSGKMASLSGKSGDPVAASARVGLSIKFAKGKKTIK